MSLGVKASFWNCFPVGEYFDAKSAMAETELAVSF